MTARALLERAGCLAAELARRAGILDNTWNGMLKRDTPLTTARSPDRQAGIREALGEKIKELQALYRDMGKP